MQDWAIHKGQATFLSIKITPTLTGTLLFQVTWASIRYASNVASTGFLGRGETELCYCVICHLLKKNVTVDEVHTHQQMILNTKLEAIFCFLKDLNVLSLKRCHSVSIDLNSLEGLIIIFNINWCDIQRWQRIKAGSLGDDDIQMVVICLSFHLFFIASGEINIFVFIVYVYKEKRVFKSLSSQVPLWNSQRPFCAFVT